MSFRRSTQRTLDACRTPGKGQVGSPANPGLRGDIIRVWPEGGVIPSLGACRSYLTHVARQAMDLHERDYSTWVYLYWDGSDSEPSGGSQRVSASELLASTDPAGLLASFYHTEQPTPPQNDPGEAEFSLTLVRQMLCGSGFYRRDDRPREEVWSRQDTAQPWRNLCLIVQPLGESSIVGVPHPRDGVRCIILEHRGGMHFPTLDDLESLAEYLRNPS